MQNTSTKHEHSDCAVAELQVSYQRPQSEIIITSAESAYRVLMGIWDKQLISLQEQVYVLFLDSQCQLLCYRLLATGTDTKCLIDKKMLIAMACVSMANSIVIAHNHPSGRVSPSKKDFDLSLEIEMGLAFVQIDVKEFLIVSPQKYYSFKDNGYI